MMRVVSIAGAMLCSIALSGASCWQRDGVAVLPPEKPRLDMPDSVSMAPCADPVKLPKGEKTQQELEYYWGLDVDHLIACGAGKGVLVRFIRNRDASLRATAGK